MVQGAPPLATVIRQFDVLARDVLGGGDNFTLVTDGQVSCDWLSRSPDTHL